MTTPKYSWHTIDFRPAPSGWRAIWLNDDFSLDIAHIAGWVIQEQRAYDPHTLLDLPREDQHRDRRVLPALHDGGTGELVGIGHEDGEGVSEPWRILAPSEPIPDPSPNEKDQPTCS